MSETALTGLVAEAKKELVSSHMTAEDNAAQSSLHYRNAQVYAVLAQAQAARDQALALTAQNEALARQSEALEQRNLHHHTANVIALLNSDRSRWSVADENAVRQMLGLAPVEEESLIEQPAPQDAPDEDMGAEDARVPAELVGVGL